MQLMLRFYNYENKAMFWYSTYGDVHNHEIVIKKSIDYHELVNYVFLINY